MEPNRLLEKYDRLVPRYTSYPTAPHFSDAVTPGDYAAWLRDLPPDAPLSLYLHVPFCASLCLFCACHTTVVNQLAPLRAYADTLLMEIDLVARSIGRRQRVKHIHWGGGTPTCLPPDAMRDIMTRLRAFFDVAEDAEIAVEVDPRTLTTASLDALAEMGTTRASLGVQDFDPKVQATINRHQDFALTARCAERLRRVGIRSLNLDLIYGLPYQTVDGLRETVRQALALRPDRVAVFGYAHVPWMKKHQALIPDSALPKRDERYAQQQAAELAIAEAGYVRIGLDHFALPGDAMATAATAGHLKRNFQGYTTDDAPILLGLGASSIGSLPEGYVQNHPAVPAWRDAVRAGTLPIVRGIALTAQDRLRRDVIEQIMCGFTVDLAETAERHGATPAALMDAAPALQDMARDGLLDWDGYRVTVRPEGRPFVRNVAAAFDTWLRPGAGRHSAAV
jgi:oxygen-independent coproporphyrinogen III oxidase